jgi:DNA-binding MarR family transcriptional regulator
VGQLVAELEAKGYVLRAPDPTDRRATLIKFTEAGQGFLLDAYHVKREIEAEYTATVGEEQMELLRTALTRLLLAQ